MKATSLTSINTDLLFDNCSAVAETGAAWMN